MSQSNVERVIGRLVTDEGFRRRFVAAPHSVLEALRDEGLELNSCELRALAGIDPFRLESFVSALDPCIQKVDLDGEPS